MKKIIALGLLLSSISLTTFAQQQPTKETHEERKRMELVNKTAEEIAKKRTHHIDKEVQLTPQQRKNVYEFYFNEAKAKIEAEEKASQNAATTNTKKDSTDGVHKLLTPEQQKKLADKKNKSKKQKSTKSKQGKSKNSNSSKK